MENLGKIPRVNNMLKQENGQAVVEATITAMVAINLITVLICFLWIFTLKMVAHRALYEAVVCEQLYPKQQNCRVIAKKKLSPLIFDSQIIFLHIYNKPDECFAEIQFILPMKFILNVSESVQLPLGI
jgi:hypothetical protein